MGVQGAPITLNRSPTFVGVSGGAPTSIIVDPAQNDAIVSAAAEPDPTVPVDPVLATFTPQPNPPETQQDRSDSQGSLGCKWLSKEFNPCPSAWGQYDDDYVYHGYTSYVYENHQRTNLGIVYPDWPYGCTAIFDCNDDAAFELGMTGKQIKAW